MNTELFTKFDAFVNSKIFTELLDLYEYHKDHDYENAEEYEEMKFYAVDFYDVFTKCKTLANEHGFSDEEIKSYIEETYKECPYVTELLDWVRWNYYVL